MIRLDEQEAGISHQLPRGRAGGRTGRGRAGVTLATQTGAQHTERRCIYKTRTLPYHAAAVREKDRDAT